MSGARGRRRLDQALAEAGLAPSRARAQALIMAGKVRVGGETERRPDRQVTPAQDIEVAQGAAFASRGALKLGPALDRFGVEVAGRVCADIGASTGGFTDVLLRRGAARVYAVDVGRGLLHWRLRQDPRVTVMEGVNARHLQALPEAVSLVTVDVSFIGLEKVLPAVAGAAPGAELVVLFKPQFQAGRGEVGKGGVVRDPAVVGAALDRFRAWCGTAGLAIAGEAPSEIPGPAGNRELLLHLLARGPGPGKAGAAT
ncbi:MAG: TlyA family RNA methyltransferase [Candidatus Dormibacterales bacterium]